MEERIIPPSVWGGSSERGCVEVSAPSPSLRPAEPEETNVLFQRHGEEGLVLRALSPPYLFARLNVCRVLDESTLHLRLLQLLLCIFRKNDLKVVLRNRK